MDDCVDESESLVSLSNLKTEEQSDGEVEKEINTEVGQKREEEKEEVEKKQNDGYFINQLISHLPVFGEAQEPKEEGHEEKQEDPINGGGVMNELITDSPVSIPDHDSSPRADEASLLIHIVED